MRKAFKQIDGRRCNKKKQLTEAECRSAAHILPDVVFSEIKKGKFFDDRNKWPLGCFVFNQKLWFNTNPAARGKCPGKDTAGVACICFEKNTPVAEPPPVVAIPGAYTEVCKTCQPNGFVGEGDCVDYARSLALPFHGQVATSMNELSYPKGCFLIKKTLWHNKANSNATCDRQDTQCICGGGKEAYVQISATCPVEERLAYCDCKRQADTLGLTYSSSEMMSDPNYPAGCFMIAKKLWFNSNKTSAANCGEDTPCICARAR